jgi:hypothetical protein
MVDGRKATMFSRLPVSWAAGSATGPPFPTFAVGRGDDLSDYAVLCRLFASLDDEEPERARLARRIDAIVRRYTAPHI